MTLKRRGKGRPRIDDRTEVLAAVTAAVNADATVRSATRRGLLLVTYKRATDGSWVRVKRQLSPATFERRYREALSEIEREFGSARLSEGTRYIGIVPPQLPKQFVPARELKRGRPKKTATG